MRKASIRNNHHIFEVKLDSLEQLARGVIGPNSTFQADARSLFAEGFALLLTGYWEELVDDDFVDALNRDTSQYAEQVGLVLPKNLSRDICFGLLVGDRYLDFRSVGDLIHRSEDLLVAANNPFVHIPRPLREPIDDFLRVRNYLSHRSERARRGYERVLRARFNYENVVEPGQLLRAQGGRYFFDFMTAFRQASVAMRNAAPF